MSKSMITLAVAAIMMAGCGSKETDANSDSNSMAKSTSGLKDGPPVSHDAVPKTEAPKATDAAKK